MNRKDQRAESEPPLIVTVALIAICFTLALGFGEYVHTP